MQIQVIHNRRRMDRYEILMRNVESNNLDIRIWDSVHEHTKSKENISAAHRRIILWAKENNMDCVAVAEDDFQLVSDNSWQYFLDSIPNDYDLFLSNVIWGHINSDNTISDFAGLNLYVCHSRYYDRFLESDPKRDIDRAQMRKGVFRVCVPFAAIQAETYSDNQKKTHKNSKLYKDRKLFGQN